jgi:hypothetical protein
MPGEAWSDWKILPASLVCAELCQFHDYNLLIAVGGAIWQEQGVHAQWGSTHSGLDRELSFSATSCCDFPYDCCFSGVMDERGKFIYISKDEMEAVAAYIRRNGRISIAALAAQSNDLIDLEAKSANAVTAAGVGRSIDFDSMMGEAAAEPAIAVA